MWATLLSVVVGAVIGGFLTYLPELRRERRADRAAKRLVHYELRSALNTLIETQADLPSKEQFLMYRENVMPMDAWRDNRVLLAGTLRDDDLWLRIVLAFRAIEAEKIHLSHAAPTDERNPYLGRTMDAITDALEPFEKPMPRRRLQFPRFFRSSA